MQTSKKTLQLIFVWGLFLGAICYLGVYGPRVLDVCNDGWILKANDPDLRQHYVGFLMYRNSPLAFPFGMTDALSYPEPMSILYTDSIPIFALLARLLSPLLPGVFQYFGLFGLMSFMLMGGLSARILYRVTKSTAVSAVLPVLFILSFPMLQRNFYHTSLTAQWIILLCVELWLAGICGRELKVQCAWWAFIGFLCASIHIYFLPMALCLLAGMLLCKWLGGKLKDFKELIFPVACLLISAAVTLWMFGAFEGKASASYEVGIFGMNLNSFVNSMGYGKVLKGLPTATEFQFEGAVYLGFGGILLLLFAIAFICIKNKTVLTDPSRIKDLLHPKKHPLRFSVIVVCLVFLFVSVSPLFSLGDKILLTVPYPGPIGKIAGIFRSNGRFAWPVLYILYILGAWLLAGGIREKKRMLCCICGLIVILQCVDLSPLMAEKHERFAKYYKPYVTDWDVAEIPDTYRRFVSYEDDVTFLMELGYYASKHDMTLNRFYFARNIDETVSKYEDEISGELQRGEIREDTVYIFDLPHYEQFKESGLHFYPSQKCVFGTKEPISGREELTLENLSEIKWPKK